MDGFGNCTPHEDDKIIDEPDGGSGGEEKNNDFIGNGGIEIDIPDWLDEWLWDQPNVVGIHWGITGQGGIALEPGYTPIELALLFNWRSGEISLFASKEIYGYLGGPTIFGASTYGGVTFARGMSRNTYYQGPSLFGGLTSSVDFFAKGGGSIIGGIALAEETAGDVPPPLFIDPNSRRYIEYEQFSLSLGGNLAPNGEDTGVLGGLSITKRLFNIEIPYWPHWR